MPVGILERSLKLTNEPPQGLKQNLKRAFATYNKEDFELYDVKLRSILFGLCHFHSVIIERMKFGPKGWNRTYPFNTGMERATSDWLAGGRAGSCFVACFLSLFFVLPRQTASWLIEFEI